jgi:hypothetical protein
MDGCMIGDTLHVRQLRVRRRGPLASPVGTSARIEDALRTSSKPSAWHGRVVLVRHLRVRLSEGAPAHHMAMAIEREWQRLARGAVEYVRASPSAEVVWFAGQVEARLAVIARLAADEDVSAWFWRRLLPLDAIASRDEQLVALFSAPWADLRVADDEQMRFVRLAFGALRTKARAMHVVNALSETALQRLLPLQAGERARRWPSPFIASTMNASHGTVDEPAGEDAGHGDAAQTDETIGEIAPSARESLHARALRIACSAIEGRLSEAPSSESGIAPRRIALGATSAPAEGVTTGWAGLFFVLNLLEHLVNPPTLPSDTVAILHSVAGWLRVRSDDAIYESLAALNADGEWPDVPPATLRSLRLACVTMTRRPLRRILARAGRILVTRTHLTIVFDLNSVRLDVRKAGLDLDPGWLPRLGRAVRFEYE